MVYPALTYLAELDYTTSETEGNRKRFHLAPAGKEHLLANRDRIELLFAVLSHMARKMAWMKRAWNSEAGEGAVGYLIGEAHQSRGLGTRAVRLLVGHLFQETPLRRLQALVSVENLPSQKLLRRLGFAFEGTLRQHFVIQGKPVDEMVFAVLREEWKPAR